MMLNRFFIWTGVFAVAFLSFVNVHAAKGVIDNENIPVGECRLAFYKKPIPTKGPKHAIQLDAFYRDFDVFVEVPKERGAYFLLPEGSYTAAALICKNRIFKPCEDSKLGGVKSFTVSEEDPKMHFTVATWAGSKGQSFYSCRANWVESP